jgi:UDPglucose 6-dehydrogenase
MRVVMIGTGYVGLVSGVCFAEFGHEVVCVDKIPEKIAALKAGKVPIFEPGLDEMAARNVAAGRLSFATDLAASVKGAEAVFIAVGTPPRKDDDHADLSFVFTAAREIAAALDTRAVVVTKSTVPVGTNARIRAEMRAAAPDAEFDVVSNPEFLREGAGIRDFMEPDRIVIGCDSDRAREVMETLYQPVTAKGFPLIHTDLESAEMIKYAANAFLATKITFINEVANLCERVGADVTTVARGIGLDGRIGPKFLMAGPGYGGSCFPKDTRAFARTGQEYFTPLRIVETVIAANEKIKQSMVTKIIAACGGSVAGLKIAVLGVTFKPDTNDMRDAPSLTIIPGLVGAGARVVASDPEARAEGRALLPGVSEWVEDAYQAAEGANALVLLTEWDSFRNLDLERIGATMRNRRLIDLRNVYSRDQATRAGFNYVSVGR